MSEQAAVDGRSIFNGSRAYCHAICSEGRYLASPTFSEVEQQFIDPREQCELPAIVLFGDNQGSIFLIKNLENHRRTKHIDVQYHFTRARVESHKITVEYIPTADMTADILTKSLEWVNHERHLRGMGLVDQRSGN